jgi:hypothetical protein
MAEGKGKGKAVPVLNGKYQTMNISVIQQLKTASSLNLPWSHYKRYARID